MPWMKDGKRDYKKEYAKYHSKDKQKKNRAGRNHARSLMIQLKVVHKGDGKDVDHKDRNPQNNGRKNLRIQSKAKNRSRNK